MFDVLFFGIVVVVLLYGVVFGIIIDTFSALRDEHASIVADSQNFCTICNASRADMELQGTGGLTIRVADVAAVCQCVISLFQVDFTQRGTRSCSCDRWLCSSSTRLPVGISFAVLFQTKVSRITLVASITRGTTSPSLCTCAPSRKLRCMD